MNKLSFLKNSVCITNNLCRSTGILTIKHYMGKVPSPKEVGHAQKILNNLPKAPSTLPPKPKINNESNEHDLKTGVSKMQTASILPKKLSEFYMPKNQSTIVENVRKYNPTLRNLYANNKNNPSTHIQTISTKSENYSEQKRTEKILMRQNQYNNENRRREEAAILKAFPQDLQDVFKLKKKLQEECKQNKK